jgi:acyl carrier protein
MTSRATVTVMLELENEFGLEFPEEMLRRDVFQSILAMSSAIQSISKAA